MNYGVDTVVLGCGTASRPSVDLKFRQSKSGAIYGRSHINGVQIFVSSFRDRWHLSFQVSLPKLLLGSNFQPWPVIDLQEAIQPVSQRISDAFPGLSYVPISSMHVSRIDFAFDTEIPNTLPVFLAMLRCYAEGRNEPGFIYKGRKTHSFYTKDSRGRDRKLTYRSGIAYGKNVLPDGRKGLRIESRLHSGAISYYVDSITFADLPWCGQILQARAWDYINQRFQFLDPVDDERHAQILSGIRNNDTREAADNLLFFIREVDIKSAAEYLFPEDGVTLARKLMEKHGGGYGDPGSVELRLFADVRRAINAKTSCPY